MEADLRNILSKRYAESWLTWATDILSGLRGPLSYPIIHSLEKVSQRVSYPLIQYVSGDF